jgi:hypothetical protein
MVRPGTAAPGRRDAPPSKPVASGKIAQGRVDDSLTQADPAAATNEYPLDQVETVSRPAEQLDEKGGPGIERSDHAAKIFSFIEKNKNDGWDRQHLRQVVPVAVDIYPGTGGDSRGIGSRTWQRMDGEIQRRSRAIDGPS